MDIGIIGAGKVGCSIGRYLKDHRQPLTGYYSKTMESAEFAAEFTRTTAFEDLTDIILASDTLMIATPDDQVREVWDHIARYDIQDYRICHFSGALSSDVFQGAEKKHAHVCSVHPIYAFSDKNNSYQQLQNVYFTVEGDDEAVQYFTELFTGMGNHVIRLDSKAKAMYHAAASLVSNHVLGLLHSGIGLLTECGFSEEEAYQAFTPLILNNVTAGCKYGMVQSLTGPIERNDIQTVDKHIEVLPDRAYEIYRSVGQELVAMAKEKHPERDYTGMELRFD